MQSRGVAATFLGPIESLRYFTGLVWQPSERLLGALVTEDRLTYIVPGFERSRVESLPHLPGDILSWEEDESSAALVAGLIPPSGILALVTQSNSASTTPLQARWGRQGLSTAAACSTPFA
ncbi:Xaa-Pro aminopeptidase [Rhizobium sp. BK181]|nr:Xaa-Pro aminopeptidase [Rhizobium sp. BK181]